MVYVSRSVLGLFETLSTWAYSIPMYDYTSLLYLSATLFFCYMKQVSRQPLSKMKFYIQGCVLFWYHVDTLLCGVELGLTCTGVGTCECSFVLGWGLVNTNYGCSRVPKVGTLRACMTHHYYVDIIGFVRVMRKFDHRVCVIYYLD